MRIPQSMTAILLAAGAIGCASSPAATDRADRPLMFQALYCPECAAFNDETLPLNASLDCAACGKRPLLVDASPVTWYWCAAKSRWAYRPCQEGAARCTPHTSTALVIEPAEEGPRVPVAYCPQCRRIRNEWSTDGGPCPVCAKPTTCAGAIERTVYWCACTREWKAAACTHASAQCCTPRTVLVLACLCGPMRAIAHGGPHCVSFGPPRLAAILPRRNP